MDPKDQDWNPYLYCGVNPVMMIDPNGENWLGAAIGGPIGAYIFGALANGGSANPGDWAWNDLNTYTAILGGATAGASLGSGIENAIAKTYFSTSGNSARTAYGRHVFNDLVHQEVMALNENVDIVSEYELAGSPTNRDWIPPKGYDMAGGAVTYDELQLSRGGGQGRIVTENNATSKTRQIHHGISKTVYKATQQHPILKDVYKARDPRFITVAKDAASHTGYQQWHRALDAQISNWIKNNPNASVQQFESFLRVRYQQPDLITRFPNGF